MTKQNLVLNRKLNYGWERYELEESLSSIFCSIFYPRQIIIFNCSNVSFFLPLSKTTENLSLVNDIWQASIWTKCMSGRSSLFLLIIWLITNWEMSMFVICLNEKIVLTKIIKKINENVCEGKAIFKLNFIGIISAWIPLKFLINYLFLNVYRTCIQRHTNPYSILSYHSQCSVFHLSIWCICAIGHTVRDILRTFSFKIGHHYKASFYFCLKFHFGILRCSLSM